MTATPQQLANYLDTHIDWARDSVPRYLPRHEAVAFGERPAPQQLASALLADMEFRALGLGTWLATDQGRLVAEAVELISPPFLRSDERVLQEALELAAQKQAQGKQWAGLAALGAVAIAALVAVGSRSSRS